MKTSSKIIAVAGVILLSLILCWLNVFQQENGLRSPFFIIPLIAGGSLITLYFQKQIDQNRRKSNPSLENLDGIKLLFSLMILVLHLRPFLNSSNELDMAFNNILTRVCVPFFFVTTGFLCAFKEEENPHYINNYIKKTIPVYLIWSLIYLPVTALHALQLRPLLEDMLQGISISPFLAVISIAAGILAALFYTGVYYHLWYFPAVLLSLWILQQWKKRFSVKTLLVLSLFLLLFGATETYYGLLPEGIKAIVSEYYRYFYTTRNFLFFALFYVVLGYVLKEAAGKISNSFILLVFSIFLLIFEGIILHDTERLNSNILLFCIPTVCFLFISVLYLNPFCKKKSLRMRALSKYYYLCHPAVIFFLRPLFDATPDLQQALVLTLTMIAATHFLSAALILLKKKFPSLRI